MRIFRMFLFSLGLTFFIGVPSIAAQQPHCPPNMIDSSVEEQLRSIRDYSPMMGVYDGLREMEPMIKLMEGFAAADICMSRTVSFLKAMFLTLLFDFADSEKVFSKIALQEDIKKAGMVEVLARFARTWNLSVLRRDEEANALAEDVVAELIRRLGADHPMAIAAVGALGDLAIIRQEFKLAQQHYESQTALLDQYAPKDSSIYCASKIALAEALLHLGRWDEARALADEIFAPDFGGCAGLPRDHPWIGEANWIRGAVLLNAKDTSNAINAFVEARRIAKLTFGPDKPDALQATFALAEASAMAGDPEAAAGYLNDLTDQVVSWLDVTLFTSGDRTARRRFAVDQTRYLELALLIAMAFPDSPAVQGAAAAAILKFKGAQAEEEAVFSRLLQSPSVSADVRKKAERVVGLRRDLSAAYTGVSLGLSAPTEKLEALTLQLERAESDLAQSSNFFDQQLSAGQADLSDIRETLMGGPAPSVLVEYKKFRRRNLGDLALGAKIRNPSDDPKDYGWAAVVIDRADTRVVELPGGNELDALLRHVTDFEKMAAGRRGYGTFTPANEATLNRMQRALYQILIEPLRIDTGSSIIFSIDAELALLNFAMLRGLDERYWIEDPDLSISVVQTGRVLVAPAASTAKGFVGVGGVDYGTPASEEALHRFKTLPQTGRLVDEYASIFKASTSEPIKVMKGKEPDEAALQKLQDVPRVLHFLTHGLFGSRDDLEAKVGERLRPMALAGISLAGANLEPRGAYDGILSALEAQDLNLVGNELVFVAACEAGRGIARRGEEFHGLARALRVAGSRHFISAIRTVTVEDAHMFSVVFYKHLMGDGGLTVEDAYLKTIRQLVHEGDKVDWTPFIILRG